MPTSRLRASSPRCAAVFAPPTTSRSLLRRLLLGVAVASLAIVATIAAPPGAAEPRTAEAASNDVIAIVVEGTGFGHGRGMSQWGAYGYAVDHGWDWKRILDHYYGGTTSGSVSSGQRIDVRLTKYDGLGDVGVISHGSGVRWGSTTAPAMRAVERSAGVFDVYRGDRIACPGSGSVAWSKIGTETQRAGSAVRFTAADGDSASTGRAEVLGVCSSNGSVTHYRGAIEVVHTSSGNRVVNDVTVENYLRGVVPKESAASWAYAGGGAGANALRAQAVAARSYGLAQNRSYTYEASSMRYATTCDTTSCQVYGGSATRSSATGSATRVEQDSTDAAIAATANVVRRSASGSIASTEFSASNGPRTAGGTFPAVDDIGDDTASNPNHRWTRIIDAKAFAADHGLGTITDATTTSTTNSGYRGFDGVWYDDVVVTGTRGTFRQQAWDFRNAMDLKSPGFTVRVVRRDATTRSMAVIGDSVANSIVHPEGEFRRLTNGTYSTQTFDEVDSRCTTTTTCPGTSGLEAAQALPSGLDVVVVELGYNDDPATFGSKIDAMMEALRSRDVGQVAWVNMADIRRSGGRSVYAASNAALETAAQRWSNLDVLDWNAASDTPERPRWFTDGVHLTTTGQAQYALWLRSRLVDLAPSHYLAPPARIELPVVGQRLAAPDGSAITVPDDATGVALNVTMVRPADTGFGTVWPCGGERPTVSSTNFVAGEIVANNVIAPIGDDGTVCLYSSVGTNLVVDVAGWFAGAASSGSDADPFVGLLPQRRVDTRIGIGARARVTPPAPLRVPVAGLSAQRPDGTAVTVPDDVAAVAVNVAVVRPNGRGFATVWPCGTTMPVASNVNFEGGVVVSNGVVAPVDADGDVCIHVSSPADVIVDLAGYFDEASGADAETSFSSATPTRLVDTRLGVGAPARRVDPSSPVSLKVRGVGLTDPSDPNATVTVPDDASAVAVNLTVVNPSDRGFATVWPCGTERPLASNVNFVTGRTRANSVIAPIGSDGTICVFVDQRADVIVDVAGWFRGGDQASFVGAVPRRLVDTREATGPAPTT